MMDGYGQFGGAGLGDALADLNDAFGELDGFGEVAKGAFMMGVPVLVGGGIAFGTVALMDYFISDAGTKASIGPYKWLIGAGVGTLAGVIVWKAFNNAAMGVVTIAASIVLSLVVWGYQKMNSTSTAGMRQLGRIKYGKALGRYQFKGALGRGGVKGVQFGRYGFQPKNKPFAASMVM